MFKRVGQNWLLFFWPIKHKKLNMCSKCHVRILDLTSGNQVIWLTRRNTHWSVMIFLIFRTWNNTKSRFIGVKIKWQSADSLSIAFHRQGLYCVDITGCSISAKTHYCATLPIILEMKWLLCVSAVYAVIKLYFWNQMGFFSVFIPVFVSGKY